ncbi:unnamed protein product [Symbiodinium natans]|uniref:CENP-V/GFA domain-containing protein n=1 Tax=Symbiodinium natans TaxID=878477 RepID=A0A812ULX5_9DINO|nr:unnamed protein product [Symbiodinium natans]
MASGTLVKGTCGCGSVQFQVNLHEGSPAQILTCNCQSCRRVSGAMQMHWAAFPRADVEFLRRDTLKEFAPTKVAKRRFCGGCGAQVAMDYDEEHTIWISMGLCDEQHFADFLKCRKMELKHTSGHIFWENRSSMLEVLQGEHVPTSEGFGFYVHNCAAPPTEGYQGPYLP